MKLPRSRLTAPLVILAVAGCNASGSSSAVPATPYHVGPVAETSAPASRVEKLLYSFRATPDGADPLSTPVIDGNGTIYGTTAFGGTGTCFGGCGTVFALVPSRKGYAEHVIYNFTGANDGDGAGPAAGITIGPGGALYGTTEYGGNTNGDGTVFELMPTGSNYVETVLHRFKGGKDGTAPLGGITLGTGGALFGTTLLGGDASACGQTGSGADVGCGTVFELKPVGPSYVEHVLHRFQSGGDGATPGSAPLVTGSGALYGTAATGGGDPTCGSAPINTGCGTVYALKPTTHGYALRILYTFVKTKIDGANPFAGLFADGTGALYGTTQYGGTANQGSAFKLTPGGSQYAESIIHSFGGGSDGSYPLDALAGDAAGTLFGTTQYGGSSASAGIVFALHPHGTKYSERVLLRFGSTATGEYPVGGLVAVGTRPALYGATSYGGTASAAGGTVFKLSP
jgi:uncharacterized repeat protein (TIGR03803 family)